MSTRGSVDTKPVAVVLLISSLEFGGAERQVVEMTRTFDRTRVDPVVCSLSPQVPLAAALPFRDSELFIVERRSRFDLTTVFRVARFLRQRRVDVVHAFLLDAEIVARLSAPLARVPVVVASERNTDYTRPLLHRIALRLTQPLFDVMVANSHAGKAFNMRTLGLKDSRIEVVHNGVDVERFRPNPEAGRAFRRQHGIPSHAPLVAMVASFKRQKGQACFLRMARQVLQTIPNALFLVVGEPVRDDFEASSRYRDEVLELAESLGLGARCRFLPNQKQIEAVYNACNLTALLSAREGTPNVVLESMACGVPVVVSDAADNATIVRDGVTGWLVPREDPTAAASRTIRGLSNRGELDRMAKAAREHTCREFSIQRAARKTERIYRKYLRLKTTRHRQD